MGRRRIAWFARTRQRAVELLEHPEEGISRWCRQNLAERTLTREEGIDYLSMDDEEYDDILSFSVTLTARNIEAGIIDSDNVLSTRGEDDLRFF